ncbi:MAG: transglycosylase SLT domain-containing protein [bacterium]|nr:transglycosylase SLT domain-containing protein [bacterium]
MENTLHKQQIFLNNEDVLNLTEERFNFLTNSIGTTMPFKFDAAVKTQINYMLNPNSSFLYKACLRKDIYFRVFEEVLDRKGMPQEIKYLSIVESLLSPNAVSWCGATGLWQFMPATGRMMDLQIDGNVDERKDIYKSTEKACEYLQSMHDKFGDWLLALAAYNGGPGNVGKAISRSGGKRTFWEIKPYLPKETQNYIPKFLATAFIMSFAPPIDESTNHLSANEMLVPVKMCCPIDMKYISAVVNINEYEQNEWNSTYKDGIIPSGMENKTIALPYSKAMQLAQWQDSIYQISANAFNPLDYIRYETIAQSYKVKKGQTIAQIADICNVSAGDVKRWNHLKSSKLKVGRTLKIYKSREITMPIAKTPPLGFFFYITEKEGQSMNDICSKFNEIDIERSCEINLINSPNTPIGKGKLIKIFLK